MAKRMKTINYNEDFYFIDVCDKKWVGRISPTGKEIDLFDKY